MPAASRILHVPDSDAAVEASSGAVESAVERIRARLLRGLYVPGQRLVEADLVRDLGIGRGSLREALQRLASEGLVVLVRNRGAVVRRLTRAETTELYQVREAIEGMAAGLAALRMHDPAVRVRFEAAVRHTVEEGRTLDLHDYAQSNVAFHRALVEASGNRHLARMVDQLHLVIFALQFRHRLTLEDRDVSVREHQALASAVLSGSAAAARRAMVRHIRSSWKFIEELPPQEFGS